LWKPLPENKTPKRSGAPPVAAAALVWPQTGSDSSQGRAIETPTPRRKVRRDNERFMVGFGI
jgi:hypothetical protein